MQCPKCKAAMEAVSTSQGDVMRCVSCKGLWLDMFSLDDFKKVARDADIGDPEVGAKFNMIDRIYCPVCPNNKLIRMVDPGQPHIWYESCPTCYGRYYDAGELTDLADYTLSDFIKSFKATERF